MSGLLRKRGWFLIVIVVLLVSVLAARWVVQAQDAPAKPEEKLNSLLSYSVAPSWVYVGPLPNMRPVTHHTMSEDVAPYWVYTGPLYRSNPGAFASSANLDAVAPNWVYTGPYPAGASIKVAPYWVYVGPLPGMRAIQ